MDGTNYPDPNKTSISAGSRIAGDGALRQYPVLKVQKIGEYARLVENHFYCILQATDNIELVSLPIRTCLWYKLHK